ncbi:MAG: GntR family transcriptional regulator [Ruminococcus sp.]|nr:GntR family transcriptional regulator [Ruminococcus sp.]
MFQIDFAAREPIYEQLYNDVIKLAASGVIKPGDKLPPVRVVAADLGINPNTAAKAYRELENEGYIYSSVGRGSFLTDKLSENSAQKRLITDAFRNAVMEANAFGAEKEELLRILEEVYR